MNLKGGAAKAIESLFQRPDRADLAVDIGRNLVHASGSVESAKREIARWFKPGEKANTRERGWLYE